MVHIDQLELAKRLRMAREVVGFTRARASTAIGMSRSTLVAIEEGTRQVTAPEIDSLAVSYETSVNHLMAPDAVHLNLRPRFRSLANNRQDAVRAVVLLNRLAATTVELEQLLGIRSTPVALPDLPIRQGSIKQQAESAALIVRQCIGIGLNPVRNVIALLEFEMGFRLFVRNLPPKIFGAFAFDATAGACILLNARHTPESQAMTAAHELGHFVSDRSFGDIVEHGDYGTSAVERFANAFSYEFLMPSATILRRFREVVDSYGKFAPHQLGFMARSFFVSPEAMCKRLESLSLLPSGTYSGLGERGFSTTLVEAAETEGSRGSRTSRYEPRLTQLAAAALERELLSEGQVARMLDLDRVDVRRIIDSTIGPRDEAIAFDLL